MIDANPWIKDCGFSIEHFIHKQLLTEETKRDISAIIEYLLHDESQCFEDLKVDKNGIYNILLRLRKIVE